MPLPHRSIVMSRYWSDHIRRDGSEQGIVQEEGAKCIVKRYT